MSKIMDGIVKDVKSLPKKLKRQPGEVDAKKILIKSVPYILTGYFMDKAAWLYRTTPGEAIGKLLDVANGMGGAFKNPLPSFHWKDLLIGIGCGIAFKLIVDQKAKNAKKFRKGEEYGSARWGNSKDIAPYMDPVFENNIILTASERLMCTFPNKGREKLGLPLFAGPSHPKYARNKNVLVIGGSGSGKTRFYVKPQLMQMHSSYVVTDPKGTIVEECGKMLKDNDYDIKVLNTINFKKSMRYNPFSYIRSEKDILKLVNTLIVNTKGEGQQATEDFWVKAERLLYTAYIGLIYYEGTEEEKNFAMLIDMIDMSETREEDETFENAIDLEFKELEERKPYHFAVRQYKKYKLAAGRTGKYMLIPRFRKRRNYEKKCIERRTAR